MRMEGVFQIVLRGGRMCFVYFLFHLFIPRASGWQQQRMWEETGRCFHCVFLLTPPVTLSLETSFPFYIPFSLYTRDTMSGREEARNGRGTSISLADTSCVRRRV